MSSITQFRKLRNGKHISTHTKNQIKKQKTKELEKNNSISKVKNGISDKLNVKTKNLSKCLKIPETKNENINSSILTRKLEQNQKSEEIVDQQDVPEIQKSSKTLDTIKEPINSNSDEIHFVLETLDVNKKKKKKRKTIEMVSEQNKDLYLSGEHDIPESVDVTKKRSLKKNRKTIEMVSENDENSDVSKLSNIETLDVNKKIKKINLKAIEMVSKNDEHFVDFSEEQDIPETLDVRKETDKNINRKAIKIVWGNDKNWDVSEIQNIEPLDVNNKKINGKAVEIVAESDEHFDLSEVQDIPETFDEDIEVTNSSYIHMCDNSDETIAWPESDMTHLLCSIKNFLPKDDRMFYKSRASKLDWDKIAFHSYSGKDCERMWESIFKQMRKFRFLEEIVDDAQAWLKKSWTDFYQSSKPNKQPDLSKQPLSPYMIFYFKHKDKILEKHPKMKVTDLEKKIAGLYKAISPDMKEKYNNLAKNQRLKYLENNKVLNSTICNIADSSSTSTIQDAPEKPLTPFKLFFKDQINDRGYKAILEEWKNMSDAKKIYWINLALKQEVQYEEKMKIHWIENPTFTPSSFKSVLTKNEQAIWKRMNGAPEKPPNSGYNLFCRLMTNSKEFKTVKPQDRWQLAVQQWNNCTQIEKAKYDQYAKSMLEEYNLQYTGYLASLPEEKRQEELLNYKSKRKHLSSKNNNDEPVEKHTKTENNEDNFYEDEHKAPPNTPYLFFVKIYRSKFGNNDDVLKIWKDMTDEQRDVYSQQLNHLKNEYIKNYKSFLKELNFEQLKNYYGKKKDKLYAQYLNESSDESESAESYQDDTDSTLSK